MRRSLAVWLLAMLAAAALGCATVQPWERESLSLTPMSVEGDPTIGFEQSYQIYREGAAGGGGSSSGGGCGCS